ncbi:unnamed protein product [Penicillium nalgiovense]|uniref:Uncharacterized protein n=1 Tax=Penicillium nalgiovense TaxID=60175 RepID=A0A9W4MYL0_PENNA|nr:unnamed protein product [Penicillium nalgiovense]CAG7951275.1 unnamed protein product [Penicillium nalgiovense]CAG8067750.1 unnamed protein product [Penicillium nalgiovense]CAG8132595.1 unnamed protein product [Penicillium nalgiovense]CAG8135625.1 unnamed protein product [Penicillium nalgiovense]
MSLRVISKYPIPRYPNEWERRAVKNKVRYTPLSQLDKVDSASKMGEAQFLRMRTLWPKAKKATDFPKPDSAMSDRVSEVVDHFPEFDAYLNSIDEGKQTFNDRTMGVFQLVMQSQRQVSADPNVPRLESDSYVIRRSARIQNQPRPSPEETSAMSSTGMSSIGMTSIGGISAAADSDLPYARTKDEQLVNDALLLFLRALTVHLPDMRCEWSSIRSPFMTASFGDHEMTARIDGCLVGIEDSGIFAIAEVKPRVRNRVKWPELLWQETAEMVSWILHDDEEAWETPDHQRLLVSQDNHKIWLTLATYDARYVQYLKDERPPTQSSRSTLRSGSQRPLSQGPLHFLRMQEYGPWNIGKASDIRHLARIFVGWAFKVTDFIVASETQ